MTKEEKTKRTKERILEAAIKEFGAKGYTSTTVGTICEKYGIAKVYFTTTLRAKRICI